MEWSWADSTKLQRSNEKGEITIPEFEVRPKGSEQSCGKVIIKAKVTDQGTRIVFQFVKSKKPPKGCCEAYGWIQHVTFGGWRYDNGVIGGKKGHPSDPSKNPQGTKGKKRWLRNPWYGGSGNVLDGKEARLREKHKKDEKALENALDAQFQKWERDPRPQTSIRDLPGGVDGFITQLVCVESGKVLFQYRWVQNRRRGETKFRFVGSAGKNLKITP